MPYANGGYIWTKIRFYVCHQVTRETQRFIFWFRLNGWVFDRITLMQRILRRTWIKFIWTMRSQFRYMSVQRRPSRLDTHSVTHRHRQSFDYSTVMECRPTILAYKSSLHFTWHLELYRHVERCSNMESNGVNAPNRRCSTTVRLSHIWITEQNPIIGTCLLPEQSQRQQISIPIIFFFCTANSRKAMGRGPPCTALEWNVLQ